MTRQRNSLRPPHQQLPCLPDHVIPHTAGGNVLQRNVHGLGRLGEGKGPGGARLAQVFDADLAQQGAPRVMRNVVAAAVRTLVVLVARAPLGPVPHEDPHRPFGQLAHRLQQGRTASSPARSGNSPAATCGHASNFAAAIRGPNIPPSGSATRPRIVWGRSTLPACVSRALRLVRRRSGSRNSSASAG